MAGFSENLLPGSDRFADFLITEETAFKNALEMDEKSEAEQ